MELIDKQKAIYIASGYCHPSNIAKELEKLPTIDAQPVIHAEWKQDSIWDYLECSNCHEPFVGKNYYNFCPNCGAFCGGDNNG